MVGIPSAGPADRSGLWVWAGVPHREMHGQQLRTQEAQLRAPVMLSGETEGYRLGSRGTLRGQPVAS